VYHSSSSSRQPPPNVPTNTNVPTNEQPPPAPAPAPAPAPEASTSHATATPTTTPSTTEQPAIQEDRRPQADVDNQQQKPKKAKRSMKDLFKKKGKKGKQKPEEAAPESDKDRAADEEASHIKNLTVEEALAEFKTTRTGLTTAEALERQKIHGKNALEEEK
jgi:hypothetical protein